MAIEKTLNTRVKLRYDSHENWMTNDPVLYAGEVALSTVSVKQEGAVNFVPSVLIKVGDGTHKYSELDFAFAKSADVISAAKSEASLKAFVNNVIAEAGIASSEAMEALAGRVTTVEGDIATLKGDENTAGSVAKAIKDAIDALDLANTYVAKEEGKSLIADSEITRLAGVTNYDDTQVKADIAKKADAESMTTELGKKVDKEDGKSLVSDSEIARLAAMKDGANKVEASETNGNIKIDGVETVVYTHPEKHAIADVDGLQSALDGKQAVGDYATKTEAQGYADAKDGAIQEAKQAGLDAASALETYKGEMVTALAGKQDVIPENTYDAYGAAAQALEDAKKYADENDADTQYGIEYDSTTKKIKLVSDTSKTEIDATDFIKDGMIESVALSEDGLNLVITWNTDSDKGENNVTTIPLTGLVDIYTGVDGTTVTVSVSSDDKISAEVKTGSLKDGHIASDAAIAKGKLAADVQASLGKADTALQEHQDISHLATTEALNGVDAKFANYTNTTDMNAALELKADKTQVAADIEAAKTEAANQSAVVLSEAQKYTDAEVAKDRERLTLLEAIEYDSYVKKADAPGYDDILTKTAAQGLYQAKGEYYTKSEAEAKFTDSTEVDGQIDAKISALDLANTYQAKGEYASAEQGAKADTAIQSVKAADGSGFNVTTEGNAVTIDWNYDVVFVFDCGNSVDGDYSPAVVNNESGGQTAIL